MAKASTKIIYGFDYTDGEWRALDIIHPTVGTRRWLMKNDFYQIKDLHERLDAGETISLDHELFGYVAFSVQIHEFEFPTPI
jgi:hypothetical protein